MKHFAIIDHDIKVQAMCGLRPKIVTQFIIEGATRDDAFLKVHSSKAYHDKLIPAMFDLFPISRSKFNQLQKDGVIR